MSRAIPAFTPQTQSIAALWQVLISRSAEGRRLSWPGWLGEILMRFAHPKMVSIKVLAKLYNLHGKSQSPLRYLVADRFEAGSRLVADLQ